MADEAAKERGLLENLLLLERPPEADGAPPGVRNAYAVLLPDSSVLVDAVFRWAVPCARDIADRGHPPIAILVTDPAVAQAGDAFEELERLFGISPVFAGAGETSGGGRRRFVAPSDDPFLARAEIAPVRLDEARPETTVYRWSGHGGTLFAGGALAPDEAAADGTGPAPLAPSESGPWAGVGAGAWAALVERHPVRSVLPLAGEPIVDVADVALRLHFLSPDGPGGST